MVNTFTLDLFKDPFFIGWDRQFKDLEKVMHNSTNYPPYNLIQVTDDEYRIELALAGFRSEDLEVSQEKNVLTIKGSSDEEDKDTYIHKGIGSRSFVRTFSLAEFMEVDGVIMMNGILSVCLKRNVPEEAKPKKFEIIDPLIPEEKIFAPGSGKKKK